MNPLGSWHDFLSSHEEVIRVGPSTVVRIMHRIKGSDCSRKLVQDVKVSVVLCFDQLPQLLFSGSIHVILRIHQDSIFSQEGNCFWVFKSQRGLQELEWFCRILLSYCFNFFCINSLQSFEYLYKHLSNDINNLMVMIIKCHFKIQSHKLSQMSMSIRIFSPKNCSNSIDFIKVSSDGHLFVKLRRLSQIRLAFKVRHFEDICSSFRCSRDDLWGMNLNESFFWQRWSKQITNSCLETKNGLIGRSPEVKYSVV